VFEGAAHRTQCIPADTGHFSVYPGLLYTGSSVVVVVVVASQYI
jgi:hypothetical protein